MSIKDKLTFSLGTDDMLMLQSNSSRIFGGLTIHADHLDSFQRLKRRDAHKICALLWLLLAVDI
jgi:hypothetical protein